MQLRVLLLATLIIAIAGYFGPWTWHPAVAFQYSADDLSEFVKFMPAVRGGQVMIARELFFLPIWSGAVGVALWSGRFIRGTVARCVIGAMVVYAAMWPLPRYPFILDAYRSTEFGASFWGSLAASAACIALLALGARLSDRWRAALWIAIGLLGATIAPVVFAQTKPALDALHGWSLSIGWGLVADVAGFLVVALMGARYWRKGMARK